MSLWNTPLNKEALEEIDKAITDKVIEEAFERYKKGEIDLNECPPDIKRLMKIFERGYQVLPPLY